MDHVERLIDRGFTVAAGTLRVGGVPVSELANKYGTPLYLYDRSILDRTWSRLRAALPERFDVYYSIKANPHERFLRYFLSRGCGLEVASAGELKRALRAGCAAESIVFAGPGKRRDELRLALEAGIGEIHVESLLELERIAALCATLGKRGRIALRINPEAEAQGGAMRMGGQASPFGIDEEQLDGALDAVAGHEALELAGVHLFVGTQILDAERVVSQYRKGVELARRVADRTGRPVGTLDLGGGYGIPYFAHESELDLDALRSGLDALSHEIDGDPALEGTRVIVEPGRFLVGEAGLYVTRVNDVKTSRSKRFLIVDGGMHHHLAASGNLGQTIKRNYPIAALNRIGARPGGEVDVVGPLCTPLDVLGRGVALPECEVGDLIGVFQSGAYARTASPLGFLSHPAPPEVWVEDGADHLIRRRGTDEDLFRDLCDG